MDVKKEQQKQGRVRQCDYICCHLDNIWSLIWQEIKNTVSDQLGAR
jgi:hypothetical protein